MVVPFIGSGPSAWLPCRSLPRPRVGARRSPGGPPAAPEFARARPDARASGGRLRVGAKRAAMGANERIGVAPAAMGVAVRVRRTAVGGAARVACADAVEQAGGAAAAPVVGLAGVIDQRFVDRGHGKTPPAARTRPGRIP